MPVTVLDLSKPETAIDVRLIEGEIVETTQQLVERLRETVVCDRASLQQAAIDRQQLAEAEKRVAAWFQPAKSALHRWHAFVCDREREVLAPIKALDEIKRKAISAYKQREEQERRDREQAEAERRRREHEARVAAEAAALERDGHAELAAAVVDEAIESPLPVVVLPDETKSIPGLRFVKRYGWRYVGGDRDVA